jgi:hypothetical protein
LQLKSLGHVRPDKFGSYGNESISFQPERVTEFLAAIFLRIDFGGST